MQVELKHHRNGIKFMEISSEVRILFEDKRSALKMYAFCGACAISIILR